MNDSSAPAPRPVPPQGAPAAVLAAVRDGRITPRSLAVTALTVVWARLRYGIGLPGMPHIVHLPPRFLPAGTLVIGRDFRALAGVARPQLAVRKGATLTIGDHVVLNQGAIVNCGCRISIGSNVLLADFCVISDDNEHSVEGEPVRRLPITIGDNVWIGRNAIVLPGVTIGANSVIGAGSIVTKDIPANSVAVGNPARVVKAIDVPAGWLRD